MKGELTPRKIMYARFLKGHKVTRTLAPPPRPVDIDFMTCKKTKDTKGGSKNRKY